MDIVEMARRNAAIEELDEKYQAPAELVGLEGFLNLCEVFGGMQIYLPSLKHALMPFVYELIVKKMQETGGSVSGAEIAGTVGLSRSSLYKLYREAKKNAEE